MSSSKSPILNDVINRKYQLLAKIGSGGMGDVFLGIQRGASDFSRLVVIKRIHDRDVSGKLAAETDRMFLNEARVVASLNHPHIVKIFDFCMDSSAFCIVMEYVEGDTLQYIISECIEKGQKIPVGMACRLIYDACSTLHYAHNSTSNTGVLRRIIHRDIGLHNLMLDSNGYLKVIDFGIAKSSVQTDITSPGMLKGNPSYMAPEIFNKSTQDHRIDIYALGLCFYELLTHEKAFRFKKTVSIAEVIQEIATRELPPPSQLVPNLPEGIDNVVKKSIEKDRDKRYRTVDEFARELKSVSHKVFWTDNETKRWFADHFSVRISERREFVANVLSNAEKLNCVTLVGKLKGGQRATKRAALEATRSAPTPPPPPLGKKFPISNRYKAAAASFVLVLGITAVFYGFIFRTPSPAKEVENDMDNFAVSYRPDGAKLYIDGKELGMVGMEMNVVESVREQEPLKRVSTDDEASIHLEREPNREKKSRFSTSPKRKRSARKAAVKTADPKSGKKKVKQNRVARHSAEGNRKIPLPDDNEISHIPVMLD